MRTRRVYQRDDATGGRLGAVTETPEPTAVEGVRQYGGPVMPTACPHCHADGLQWVVDTRAGWCRICGADWYVTQHAVRVMVLAPIHGGLIRLQVRAVAAPPAAVA